MPSAISFSYSSVGMGAGLRWHFHWSKLSGKKQVPRVDFHKVKCFQLEGCPEIVILTLGVRISLSKGDIDGKYISFLWLQ